MDIVNENRVNFTAAEQADGAKVTVEGKVKQKANPLIVTGEYLIRAINGNKIGKSDTIHHPRDSSFLVILPEQIFWECRDQIMSLAPGWPFILGYSDKNFFDKAVTNGWLSTDTLLNTPAIQYNKIDLSFRSLIEPIPGSEN